MLGGSLTPGSTRRALILLALLSGFAATAHAADDNKACFEGVQYKADKDAAFEACARYIKSGKARGLDLASAYAIRSYILAERGEFDRALEEVNEALRLVPNKGAFFGYRAQVYAMKGDYDRALADADEAIRLDPKNTTLLFYRVEIYLKKGDYDRALSDADKAVRLRPKSAISYLWRGQVYISKQDPDRAIADYTKAIKLDPSDATLYTARCEAYQQKGESDRALSDCDEGLRRDPKLADGYRWRGIIYREKGDYDRAITEFTTAIKLAPGAANSYMGRCETYRRKGELERALSDCNDGVRLTPELNYVYYWRGLVYESAGELDKAKADYERVASNPATLPQRYRDDLSKRQAALNQRSPAQGQQAAATPSGETQPPVSGSSAQGGARQFLEKHGLLGIWSADCSNPPSPSNQYFIYRPLDEQRIQLDVMTGPTQRSFFYIIDSASEAGANEIAGTAQNSQVFRLQVAGNRFRLLEFALNGTKAVADGRYLADYGDPTLAGQETPWTNKCQ
jgi:tetratricopeptide (TPR) repeat protein